MLLDQCYYHFPLIVGLGLGLGLGLFLWTGMLFQDQQNILIQEHVLGKIIVPQVLHKQQLKYLLAHPKTIKSLLKFEPRHLNFSRHSTYKTYVSNSICHRCKYM